MCSGRCTKECAPQPTTLREVANLVGSGLYSWDVNAKAMGRNRCATQPTPSHNTVTECHITLVLQMLQQLTKRTTIALGPFTQGGDYGIGFPVSASVQHSWRGFSTRAPEHQSTQHPEFPGCTGSSRLTGPEHPTDRVPGIRGCLANLRMPVGAVLPHKKSKDGHR